MAQYFPFPAGEVVSLDKTEKSVVLGGALLIVIVMALVDRPSPSATTGQSPAEKKAEDEHNSRIAVAATMARELKRSMRDPDSFKLTSVLLMDKTKAVCYEYRSRNGFGGMNAGRAVFSSAGKFKTNEMDGFSGLWNKNCAHQIGTEEAETVSTLLRWSEP